MRRWKASGAFCAVVAATVVTAAVERAAACGYHGMLGDGFSAMHVRSVEVAISLREAIDAGVLKERVVLPDRVDLVGFHRVSKRLQNLRDALQKMRNGGERLPAFSLLLIESALWSRYAPDDGGAFNLKVETKAPVADEAVVVTGEAVLNSIVADKISAADAMERGLVVVDGNPNDADRLKAIFLKALASLQSGT